MSIDQTHFLDGGGEMTSAIRCYDWSSNPLGFPEDWPPVLKTAASLALNSHFPKCIVWGTDLIAIPNDAFRPIVGLKGDILGRSFRDIWEEAWDEIGPFAEKAFAGQATYIEDFPLTINRNGHAEQAYFTFCYSPIRDENGLVRGMMDTVIETTAKIEAQRQAHLINQELAHRTKNGLAVISAIVKQTFRTGGTPEAVQRSITQRIGALADAQAVLTRSETSQSDLRDILADALKPFCTGASEHQFHLEGGPPVTLSSQQSLTLALALHELATNALKYGALATPQGRIHITWQTGAAGSDTSFNFIWTETCAHPVRKPARRGFGSYIIETALAHDFGGHAAAEYLPTGLRFKLTTQMRRLSEHPHLVAREKALQASMTMG